MYVLIVRQAHTVSHPTQETKQILFVQFNTGKNSDFEFSLLFFFFVCHFAANMGGHDHKHDHAPYKVPSPDIYKVENAEELMYLRDELAKRGLKDPWIR